MAYAIGQKVSRAGRCGTVRGYNDKGHCLVDLDQETWDPDEMNDEEDQDEQDDRALQLRMANAHGRRSA